MDLAGKIAHSFFGSVTPRTAGYNSIVMSNLSIAAIVLTIFLDVGWGLSRINRRWYKNEHFCDCHIKCIQNCTNEKAY